MKSLKTEKRGFSCLLPLIVSDGIGKGCIKRNRNRAQFVNILKSGPEAKRSTGNSTTQTAANKIKGNLKT